MTANLVIFFIRIAFVRGCICYDYLEYELRQQKACCEEEEEPRPFKSTCSYSLFVEATTRASLAIAFKKVKSIVAKKTFLSNYCCQHLKLFFVVNLAIPKGSEVSIIYSSFIDKRPEHEQKKCAGGHSKQHINQICTWIDLPNQTVEGDYCNDNCKTSLNFSHEGNDTGRLPIDQYSKTLLSWPGILVCH